MKRIFLFILALSIAAINFAQNLSYGANPVFKWGTFDDGEIKCATKVTNNTSNADDTTILWEVLSRTVPDNKWLTGFCTGDLCISDPITTGSFNVPKGGYENMYVVYSFLTGAGTGKGTMTFIFYRPGAKANADTVVFTGQAGTTGLKKANQIEISTYPNPVSGSMKITLNQQTTVKLEIYNMVGKKVNETMCNGEATLDMSNQPEGIYFVRFEMNGTIYNQRFVVSRR